MKKRDCKLMLYCEDCYDQLNYLESIIKMTKNVCQEHEFSAIYYDLPNKYKFILSEERNHYINMLTIALDKINKLKEINDGIEVAVNTL